MKILKEQSIRMSILVPLSLTIIILLSAFLYSAYHIRVTQNLENMHHRYSMTQVFMMELLQRQASRMEAILVELSLDEELQRAMLAGDRAVLYGLSRPVFEQLKAQHGVTHFYFHDTEGRNFLRVYDPKRYGDEVKRRTFVAAAESNTVKSGMDIGRLGTLSYRTVLPWMVADQPLGYIEVGIEIDYLLRKLKAVVNDDFMAVISKDRIDPERWRLGRRMFNHPDDWDLFPENVISASTMSPSFLVENVLGPENVSHPGRLFTAEYSELAYNGREYRFKWFPLYNLGGEKIAKLFVLHDITQENAEFRGFIIRVLLLSGSLSLVMFTFAYTILGHTGRRLSQAQERLAAEVDKVKTMNISLEVEISQRQEVEAELKKLNDTLEIRVAQRTMALEQLNRELETSRLELDRACRDLREKHSTILHQEKMACIGQLAAGVAHDINNPMGFISNNLGELSGYAESLCRFIVFVESVLWEKCDNEEARASVVALRDQLQIGMIIDDVGAMIDESLEGSERVSRIVKNLRNFSRIDDQDYSVADVNECLESTINIVWNELKYKAEVVRAYGEIQRIPCYPGQLNQVFMNLLINAAQAIEQYGTITVKTWQEDDAVLVSISDTGVGIAAEYLGKIFEPFFTTKETGKGTGLGLSITYDIIKRHHGDISVESEVGAGTTFTIRLPLEGPGPVAGRDA